MQRLVVSGAVRPIYGSLGVKRLNDLVWDLKLSKNQAELLGSRPRGWNLLQKGTKVCYFRNRQEEFQDFYSEENY